MISPKRPKIKVSRSLNTQNHINDNYVVKHVDSHWCADYTQINHATVLPVMDLATRLILAFQITFKKDKKFDLTPTNREATKKLIKLLEEIINERSITPVLFHSDCGGVFISHDFKYFLDNHKKNIAFFNSESLKESVSDVLADVNLIVIKTKRILKIFVHFMSSKNFKDIAEIEKIED